MNGIKIIAVLCRIAMPGDCHDRTVTTSDIAEVTLQSCMMGMPALAEWMKGYPQYRLARWKCQIGNRPGVA